MSDRPRHFAVVYDDTSDPPYAALHACEVGPDRKVVRVDPEPFTFRTAATDGIDWILDTLADARNSVLVGSRIIHRRDLPS